MKNIIKTVWSCWDKIDRFVAIFSSIAIIVIMCFMCTSCNAQQPSNIPDMEYYNPNQDEDILDNYIPIYADGVVDFIYCTQDYEFIIEYQDDDYFDMDNPQQMSNTVNCASSDENLVCLYCSEEIFFEYLEWYNALTNDEVIARDNPEFYAPSDKFYIKEQWVGDVDNGYWYYKLVKK
jgi:hypothetical protein